MINLNIGALRSVHGNTNAAAANDLVQRTLARHGLMSTPEGEPEVQTAAAVMARASAMTSPMGSPMGSPVGSPLPGIRSPFSNATSRSPVIPEGAEFRQERFSCAAGSRDYRTYIPSTATGGVTGIVVMLHGCTQNPEDFALGTGMNALAEQHRFVVVYPMQSRGDHAQSCWNWFSRADQQRDRGEPSILSGITRKVMTEHGVANDRTFVAGLSAGAAMALVLGEAYPDIYSAVGAHSGLPVGSAKDVPSAFAAMAGNVSEAVNTPPAMDAAAVRTIVFHGTADATVHPSNSDRIVRRTMDIGAGQTVHSEERGSTSGRHFTRKVTRRSDGIVASEHWLVDGLGHAWSGGRSGGSYTDPNGPDASAEMVRFFFALGGE